MFIPCCVWQAAFAIWWEGLGPQAGLYSQVPPSASSWNGSCYLCWAELHVAGSLRLHVEYNFQSLGNGPLDLRILPGALDATQVGCRFSDMARSRMRLVSFSGLPRHPNSRHLAIMGVKYNNEHDS